MTTIAAWNGHAPGRSDGEFAKAIARMIREAGDPDAVALQEVKGKGDVLDRVDGYRPMQVRAGAWSEADQTAILVREDHKINRSGWLRTTARWTGPVHGLAHLGRTFVWADFGGPGAIRLVSVHRTNPDWGLAAALEEQRELRAFLGRGRSKRRTTVLAGDHNCNRTEVDQIGTTAHLLAGEEWRKYGSGVDWFGVRGGMAADVYTLDKYGSDHRAKVLDLVDKRLILR